MRARLRTCVCIYLCASSSFNSVIFTNIVIQTFSNGQLPIIVFTSSIFADRDTLQLNRCWVVSGYADLVICFHCGLMLHDWLPGDDPAIAHARLQPSCQHLILAFGDDFISFVQNEVTSLGHARLESVLLLLLLLLCVCVLCVCVLCVCVLCVCVCVCVLCVCCVCVCVCVCVVCVCVCVGVCVCVCVVCVCVCVWCGCVCVCVCV